VLNWRPRSRSLTVLKICISQTLAYLANQFITNMLRTRYFFGYYYFYATA